MTQPTPIPEAMIEAAMKAHGEHAYAVEALSVSDVAYQWDCMCGSKGIGFYQEVVDAARRHEWNAVLAAALAVCEVKERWGYRSMWSEVPEGERRKHAGFGHMPPHPPGRDVETWESSRLLAASMVAQAERIPRRLIYRLVVTTPAEYVQPSGGEPA